MPLGEYWILVQLFPHFPFIFSSPFVEESKPGASCGDKTQQPSQETAGEQAEEAKAEGSAEEAAG